MRKYVGCVVEIIYQDRNGVFSKRRIRVIAVDNGKVKAFCFRSGAPRLFTQSNIMAVQPVGRAS